jgi:hypothetical protein
MNQLTLVPFRCRFETPSADGTASGSQGEFCAFEFPGCEGCQYDLHAMKAAKPLEDPMKSNAWRGWIAGASRLKK